MRIVTPRSSMDDELVIVGRWDGTLTELLAAERGEDLMPYS